LKEKKFIRSYKELNEVIYKIIDFTEEPLSPKEIQGMILSNYNTNKLSVGPRSIAARIRGKPNVRVINTPKGNKYIRKR
jgi:hypothetical protein